MYHPLGGGVNKIKMNKIVFLYKKNFLKKNVFFVFFDVRIFERLTSDEEIGQKTAKKRLKTAKNGPFGGTEGIKK